MMLKWELNKVREDKSRRTECLGWMRVGRYWSRSADIENNTIRLNNSVLPKVIKLWEFIIGQHWFII